MTTQTMQNRQTFEDYLLDTFRQNEGKYFTKQELLNSYEEHVEKQEFMYDSFEKSIIFVNNILGGRAYYINEKRTKDTDEILYANIPIDNPVSKSIIPVDILSRGYQDASDPSKQHELYLAYNPLNKQLMKSSVQLKFLNEKYGIKKQTVMKMELGLNEKILSIPVFNYSTAQYPVYEAPEVMNIKYVNLDDNSSKYYEPQTTSQLAMINSYSLLTSIIVVVKDYFQGLNLWQFLNKEGLGAFYHIVLSPDSLELLPEQMSQIDLCKYKTFYLNIGGSERADRVSDEILSRYPMFKRIIRE